MLPHSNGTSPSLFSSAPQKAQMHLHAHTSTQQSKSIPLSVACETWGSKTKKGRAKASQNLKDVPLSSESPFCLAFFSCLDEYILKETGWMRRYGWEKGNRERRKENFKGKKLSKSLLVVFRTMVWGCFESLLNISTSGASRCWLF